MGLFTDYQDNDNAEVTLAAVPSHRNGLEYGQEANGTITF